MANLLDPFVSRLIETLVDMSRKEIGQLLGVPEEIKKLGRTLRKIKLVLHDAEKRRIEEAAINDWLRELKDVMYDADDILDEFYMEADQGTPPESSSRPSSSCGFSVFSCFRKVKFNRDIGIKVKDLNLKLEEILSQRSKLDLKISAEPKVVSRVSRKSSPVLESDIVGVGTDEEASDLLELLIKEENTSANVLVLAIVGIGGIGKTTLAQKVYNDGRIEARFGKKMWVCVSQEFSETELLRDIITSAMGNHGGEQNRALLPQNRAQLDPMVEDLLRGEKFLLVLDDVWSAEIWVDLIRNPLQGGAAGSRVLVTTRNEGIAREMKAVHSHKMNLLPPEDCWTLLCKKVAVNANEEWDVQDFKDIGMKIVEKCQGLPLAVKTIGGVLRNKGLSRDAWEAVLHNTAWSQTGLPDGVKGALYLSYDDLSSHLKQCFLYCASLFREDHEFDRSEIVQLWIAEGFVQETEGLTLEAIGEEYYGELLGRNLLQRSDPLGTDDYCRMHDLLRSLGQSLTRDESLMIRDAHKDLTDVASTKLRRLSIIAPENEEIEPKINLTKRQKSVRTLLIQGAIFDKKGLSDYLKNFLHLRVLHLSQTRIQMLPHCIGDLVHLTYLNLSDTDIKELPESIGNLTNLQFLLLRDCQFECLPRSVVKLHNLRTLEGFVVVKNRGNVSSNDHQRDWCSLEEASSLRKLRHLSIYKLERAWVEAERGNDQNRLKGHQNLESLHLYCSGRGSDYAEEEIDYAEEEMERIEKVFDVALHPPSSIRIITFDYYFGRKYPIWMESSSISFLLPNLRHLELFGCGNCPWLPPLGKLPNLECLYISKAKVVVTIGPEFYGCEEDVVETGHGRNGRKLKHDSSPVFFPRLTQLFLYLMDDLEEWQWVAEHQGVAMPRLNKLDISYCPKLKCLPEGLSRQSTCLTTLELYGVDLLKSISGFSSVKTLTVRDSYNFDLEISHLPAVEVLELSLMWHNKLPEWLVGDLAAFTTLRRLDIKTYEKQLIRRCLQNGADWPKISHVPFVHIHDDQGNYIDYIKHSSTFKTNLIYHDNDDDDILVK